MQSSCFPLASYFTFGSVYMSMPLSHFFPAYPSPSLCPQVHSLRLQRSDILFLCFHILIYFSHKQIFIPFKPHTHVWLWFLSFLHFIFTCYIRTLYKSSNLWNEIWFFIVLFFHTFSYFFISISFPPTSASPQFLFHFLRRKQTFISQAFCLSPLQRRKCWPRVVM